MQPPAHTWAPPSGRKHDTRPHQKATTRHGQGVLDGLE